MEFEITQQLFVLVEFKIVNYTYPRNYVFYKYRYMYMKIDAHNINEITIYT